MTKRKIIIQLGNKRKEFETISKKYDELLSLIEYYGYDFCLKNHIFVYSNPIAFNIVDLQLSSVSTPQPPVEDSYFVA